MLTRSLAKSRFNPVPGWKDFWDEIRKPQPFRIPILIASCAPLAVIFYWLSTETVYKDPERPRITYITSYGPDRSDEEIMASNLANQEVKDMREAQAEALAERKREIYKTLGAGIGMDVDEIERRADEERAAETAAEQARRDEMFGRTTSDGTDEVAEAGDTVSEESRNP